MVDGAAGSGSDFDLRVTRTTNTLEFDDDNADFPFGSGAPVIGGTVLTGPPWFLRVSGGGEDEPYRLYYSVQPPSPGIPAEAEPNGTIAQATPAPSGYVAGQVSPGDEDDVFSFSSPARALVFIALDADPTRNVPFNAQLQLLDADGAVVEEVDDPASTSNNMAGGGLSATTPSAPAEGIVVRVPRAGTYYVKVGSAAAPGDYILSISSACRAGMLPEPIEIVPPGLPEGNVGSPYVLPLTATGGTGGHTFELSSGTLPPGLDLAADGVISGTPEQAGTFPFTVVAVDADGATGERAYMLTVMPREIEEPPADDTQAPQTTITGRPPNRGRSRRVTFRFRSNEAGSRFQCKRDGKPFAACASPKRYRLRRGRHRLRVRAIDAAGNVDPTPAGDRFRILKPRR
jgi:hypothetical protein